MLGVMVGAMAAHAAIASIAGAALLVVVSVPCAAASRRWSFLRAHVLDLWAMALLMLALVPRASVVGGHHALALDTGWAAALILAGWLAVRARLALRTPRASTVSAAVTAAGLVLMLALCA
ncbi:MAG: hypothetical protein BGO97_04570 [Micrococcales bacterium 70-64]|nr:MAG: hypothetical protein ABT06_04575 [Leifsonia sp. SCN 70-46]OJX85068.1 MAG: hypothetical protein BGO97_04570 [Micrococcales bacterium 70-64]